MSEKPEKTKYILYNPDYHEAVRETTIAATDVSDGFHKMSELYDHRRALNSALFNLIAMAIDSGACPGFQVMKARQHFDGTMFDGYFIVMLVLPYGRGQVSYHYKLEYWDQFHIDEVDKTPEWDGHNSEDVIKRLTQYI